MKDREDWCAAARGSQRVRHNLATKQQQYKEAAASSKVTASYHTTRHKFFCFKRNSVVELSSLTFHSHFKNYFIFGCKALYVYIALLIKETGLNLTFKCQGYAFFYSALRFVEIIQFHLPKASYNFEIFFLILLRFFSNRASCDNGMFPVLLSVVVTSYMSLLST